jgi:hypothetical protein
MAVAAGSAAAEVVVTEALLLRVCLLL